MFITLKVTFYTLFVALTCFQPSILYAGCSFSVLLVDTLYCLYGCTTLQSVGHLPVRFSMLPANVGIYQSEIGRFTSKLVRISHTLGWKTAISMIISLALMEGLGSKPGQVATKLLAVSAMGTDAAKRLGTVGTFFDLRALSFQAVWRVVYLSVLHPPVSYL